MKKIITVLLILSVAIINVHATEIDGSVPVTKVIATSFSKEFSTAKEVNWSWIKEQDLFKATFSYNNKQLNAYFTREGEYVGTSRYISNDQLPLIIAKNLQQRYSDYSIRTIIENTTTGQTTYFVTLESATHGLMVNASPNGELVKYKKIRKL